MSELDDAVEAAMRLWDGRCPMDVEGRLLALSYGYEATVEGVRVERHVKPSFRRAWRVLPSGGAGNWVTLDEVAVPIVRARFRRELGG